VTMTMMMQYTNSVVKTHKAQTVKTNTIQVQIVREDMFYVK